MPKTVEAFYDGEVLRPVEPIDVEPNTNVQITVEERKKSKSIFETLRDIKIDAPEDFSENHDLYLSGEKRVDDNLS